MLFSHETANPFLKQPSPMPKGYGMVRLPHVSMHPGFAILDAVLLLMLASSRVAAKISHGKAPAISVYVSALFSGFPMSHFSNLALFIYRKRCGLIAPACFFVQSGCRLGQSGFWGLNPNSQFFFPGEGGREIVHAN